MAAQRRCIVFPVQYELNLYIVMYKKEKKVVGLERGPLSLMSTIEELLDRKVAAPV
jgi:hypothetical protein